MGRKYEYDTCILILQYACLHFIVCVHIVAGMQCVCSVEREVLMYVYQVLVWEGGMLFNLEGRKSVV